LALLVRGEANKYHSKGSFHIEATEDFAHALTLDKTVQPLLGRGFGFDDMSRFDEIFLKFHPWLWARQPMPLCAKADQDMIRRVPGWLLKGRSYFGFLGLLFMFLGKLKRKVRLRRRLTHWQQQEAAYQAENDLVTDRMRGLLAASYDAEKWQRERDLYLRRLGRVKGTEKRGPQPWLPAGKREDKPISPLCTPTGDDFVGVYKSREAMSPVHEACWQGTKKGSNERARDLMSHFPPHLVVDFLASETRGARHIPDVVKACELGPVWQWHRESAAATPLAMPEKLPPLSPRSPRTSPMTDTGMTGLEDRGGRCPISANSPASCGPQQVDSPWRVCGPQDAVRKISDQAAEIQEKVRLPAPQFSGSAYWEYRDSQPVLKPPFVPLAQLETIGDDSPLELGSFGTGPTDHGGWGSRPGDVLCTKQIS
jgi:hypothetical protein